MCLNRMKMASPSLVWCIRGSWEGESPTLTTCRHRQPPSEPCVRRVDKGLPGGLEGQPHSFSKCPLALLPCVYLRAIILPKARLSVPKAIDKLAQAIIRPGRYYN